LILVKKKTKIQKLYVSIKIWVMKDLIEKVLKTINKYNLISPKDRILLAVSGGIDSMTMLHIFNRIKGILDIEIGVASLNHGIRTEGKEEVALVKHLQKVLVNLSLWRNDALKVQKETKRNLEDVARELRFDFLNRIKENEHFNKIALAHNKNDFAETFLMHLFKGAGLKGLTSMLRNENNIIRPLIEVTREEIERYAKENRIPYVVDLTNYNLSYERNRLRYQIIPLIKSVYGQLLDTVMNFGEIALREDEFLDKVAAIELQGIRIQNEEYSLKLFEALPLSIKRRILMKILGDASSFERVENILQFMEGSQRKISIGEDLYITKTKNTFFIEHGTPFTIDSCYVLSVPGKTVIPESSIEIVSEVVEPDYKFNLKDKNIAIFDMDQLKFPLMVRFRKEGDIVEIENGHKKLQDIFVDMKVRRDLRYKIPILVDNEGKILWVVSVKRSSIAKVNESTKKALLLRIVPIK
jgi:tRNA(Ile)-lysidine synthetase, N-terminal domain/tRNA(Ile)-lysidine synthetase, C-terminal domain